MWLRRSDPLLSWANYLVRLHEGGGINQILHGRWSDRLVEDPPVRDGAACSKASKAPAELRFDTLTPHDVPHAREPYAVLRVPFR